MTCHEWGCTELRFSPFGPQHLDKLLGLKGTLSKGRDDTKLGGVESLKGRDLDKLDNWTVTNQMKEGTGKETCQILQIGWGNPGYTQTGE